MRNYVIRYELSVVSYTLAVMFAPVQKKSGAGLYLLRLNSLSVHSQYDNYSILKVADLSTVPEASLTSTFQSPFIPPMVLFAQVLNFEKGLIVKGTLPISFIPSVQTTVTDVSAGTFWNSRKQYTFSCVAGKVAAIPTGSRFSTLLALPMRAMGRLAAGAGAAFSAGAPWGGGACCWASTAPANTVRHTTRTNTASFFMFLTSL